MDFNLYKIDEDLHLIKEMKHGDTSAIETFVRKYYSDILKYCRRRTSSNEDAMDLTQEVFLRFFFRIFHLINIMGRQKIYLYVIAGHLCVDHYKQAKSFVGLDETMCMELAGVSVEDQISLENAVQELPITLKQVIELYYYQGLKINEISKILRIGVPLVKYRLAQAKKIFKETDWRQRYDTGRTYFNKLLKNRLQLFGIMKKTKLFYR